MPRGLPYRQLKQEAKDAGIFLSTSKFSPSTPGNVPPDHQDKFVVIQDLGRRQYEIHAPTASLVKPLEPWEQERKSLAKRFTPTLFGAAVRIGTRTVGGVTLSTKYFNDLILRWHGKYTERF
jgi:hypothetical protein